MYSGNKNSFISILYMFDLLSKRNVEKIQKNMAYFAIFCLFSLPPNPLERNLNFLFKKQKILYVDNKSAKFYEV